MKKIVKKNQIMITVLAIMIAVAGYLNFAGMKLGEEDFLTLDGSDRELTYEIDDVTEVENYLSGNMELSMLDEESAMQAQENMTETADETPGEAIFTSSSVLNSLSGAKLLKEQTRAKNKEALLEIINNEQLTEAAKQDAVNSMIVLTETAQKETDAEMLLEAKGFKEAVVSVGEKNVDVMVSASELTDAQTAQIIDIVQRKTEVLPENIIITLATDAK